MPKDISPTKNIDTNGLWIKDERSIMWIDSLEMQRAANKIGWIAGHGLGGFRSNFENFSRLNEFKAFDFPHNIFLEILYNSGLLGLLIFVMCLGFLIKKLLSAYKQSEDHCYLFAITLLFTVFVFVFLTLPFLSRYSAYCLAFVIGYGANIAQRKQLSDGSPT